MSKSTPLQRPQVETSVGRHDFSRGYCCDFNQSHGMLLPVFCQPVIAGTKGQIDVFRFTRTSQVIFPAFQPLQQHIEFFKVPLRFLFSSWKDWKLNINDINSSTLVGTDANGNPDLALPSSPFRMDFGNALMTRAGGAPMFPPSFWNDYIRLIDFLGYGEGTMSMASGTACQMNLFKIAAYQKVYYDYFRNSTYEDINQFAYNLDWLQFDNDSVVLDPSASQKHLRAFKNMFTLRYVNYRNDYFHNIYPSLNYSVSTPNGSDWKLPTDVVALGNGVILDAYNQASNNGASNSLGLVPVKSKPDFGISGSAPFDSVNHYADSYNSVVFGKTGSSQSYFGISASDLNINVQQIRAMFALDKLMRASAYAPKHVRDQIKARFGVSESPKLGFESERLGSFVNDIIIGEVTSTASTDFTGSGGGTNTEYLGAVGGKGIGNGPFGRKIDFYAEEDSIIIGVQYFLTRTMYDSKGIDAWNMKLVREDFFNPEFEHLGLRPMYHKELSLDITNPNNILGYTEPNLVYKVGKDVNHGLFKKTFNAVSSAGVLSTNNTDPLNCFVSHNDSSSKVPSGNGVSFDYFKAQPKDLDYLFKQAYDSTYHSQITDQFYGYLRFKFDINAPMAVHGQPFL